VATFINVVLILYKMLPVLMENIKLDVEPDKIHNMNFNDVSKGIIEGGADIIFNRFNFGVKLTPEETKSQLLDYFKDQNVYAHQLETLSEPDNFGIYFEIFPDNQQKKLGQPRKTKTLVEKNSTQVAPQENIIINGSPLKKVPDKYELLSMTKWEAAMKLWNLKEWARKKFSPDPVCKGLIVIDKHIFKDEHDLQGKSVLNYALAARSGHADLFSKVASLNEHVYNFKMFDTSFIVEKHKQFSKGMKAEDLRSLRGQATGIGYSFFLKGQSPLEAYTQLAKEFGYRACGFAAVPDPVFTGCLTNGSQWFDLDNMPEEIPGMGGIQLVGTKGNQIGLSKEQYEKNTYSFSLSDLECDTAAEFMARFTNKMGQLGARTSKAVNYQSLFLDNTSVYLPGFPLSSQSTISIGYKGNLSELDK